MDTGGQSKYQKYVQEIGEYGTVTQVYYPIAVAQGLPTARPHELVYFENGALGEIFNIHPDTVEILLFSKDPVATGTNVARSGKLFSVPVGFELLGKVINPLCQSLLPDPNFKIPEKERPADTEPLTVDARARLKDSLKTGVSVVDMLIPLGRGQRELVIGDRKSGKTAFLLATVKNQIQAGSLAIYAAVGKKKSDIRQIQDYFIREGIMDQVIIVATSSSDSPSLIYETPSVAMALAEYFRDEGRDVIVTMDDLSTHAKFYRELSLIAKNFPGRDSYPGDVFYSHAKLMERAGCFTHPKVGAVTITCLPVCETVEGDLAGYIQTNIMGMTDGHIFFDSNVYKEGRRPAVNIPLSVTRVGKQIQTPAERSVNRELLSFLGLYEKTQALSHFGAELTDHVKVVLKNGEKIYKFFTQPQDMVVPPEVQMITFSMIWNSLIDENMTIEDVRKKLIEAVHANPKISEFFKKLCDVKTFNELLDGISKNKDYLQSLCGKTTQSAKS